MTDKQDLFAAPLLPEAEVKGRRIDFKPMDASLWNLSKLHPPCIIKNYLYCDLLIKIAAGGVGKTTIMIKEAICIALGLPLFGNEVVKSGPVVIITAEDNIDLFHARFREVAKTMDLTAEQIAIVQQRVFIEYVGGESFRLSTIENDMIVPSPEVDEIIRAAEPGKPVLVTIDPAVSFSVGESRVNDAEQGLVVAMRKIRDALGCAVQAIHHSGKGNARDKTTDQYSGRNGSAMADGARMVQVLVTVHDSPEHLKQFERSTGIKAKLGWNIIKFCRPKMSFVSPQPDFYVVRDGFSMDHVIPVAGAESPDYTLTDEDLEAFGSKLSELSAMGEPPGADVQAADWVGHVLAEVLDIDTAKGTRKADCTAEQQQARDRCKEILAALKKEGRLHKKEITETSKGRSRPVITGIK